jgi:hypothetical protein
MTAAEASRPLPPADRAARSCVVVVPLYRALPAVEDAALARNVRILRDWPVVLACPARLGAEAEALARALGRRTGAAVSVAEFEDRRFASVGSYNRLLKEAAFYRRFRAYDYMLICQTDAVVFRDELARWTGLGYSFVGAPVFRGIARPADPPEFLGALNGGFSLRHVGDALRVAERLLLMPVARRDLATRAGVKALRIVARRVLGRMLVTNPEPKNEDLFWTLEVPEFDPRFRVCPPGTAARFAFEVAPSWLYGFTGGALPMGAHAWQTYEPGFWRRFLGEELFETPG